jgi:hypothetical protein
MAAWRHLAGVVDLKEDAMAITESSIIQPGTRVRLRRGRFPTDPALVGREGVVVFSSQYEANRVDVALDGDAEIQTFPPEELEVLSDPEALPADQRAARKRLARP